MMLVYLRNHAVSGDLTSNDVQLLIDRSNRPLVEFNGPCSMQWQGTTIGESKFLFSGAGFNKRVPYDGTTRSLENLNREWNEYCATARTAAT
jgi:hypothetical protein